MAKTRSMTRNQNNDDASSRKRIKNHDANSGKGVGVRWSDLDHDVLVLVMMRLGVVDFISFSGVCNTWRSFAIPNRKMFMASRPPMSISFSFVYENTCYVEDFDGRRFKTVIPRLFNRTCVGVTCGYLILCEGKSRDFWLVNPITRHQLHFPSFPHDVPYDLDDPPSYQPFKAILVFSPSTCGWLFAITHKFNEQIWFSRAGTGVWNHVPTASKILDLHVFKGKIYALILIRECNRELLRLCDIRLGLEPKFMVLETKKFPCTRLLEFVYSSENLLVKRTYPFHHSIEVHQLDFGEMKWMFREKTMEEYEFYTNPMYQNTAVKRDSWWAGTNKIQKDKFFHGMWYFPHDCLNVNLIDE